MTKLGWSRGPLPSSHRNWLSYQTGNQDTRILQVIRDPRAQMSAKSVVLLVGSDPATNTAEERAHLVCGKPHCVSPPLTTNHAQSRWHLPWPHTGHQLQRATALWSHRANRYEKTHNFTRVLAQSDSSESLSKCPAVPSNVFAPAVYLLW